MKEFFLKKFLPKKDSEKFLKILSKLLSAVAGKVNDFHLMEHLSVFDKTIGLDKIVEMEKMLALSRLLKYILVWAEFNIRRKR